MKTKLYYVHYLTALKRKISCGHFYTLEAALNYVDYLQDNLPNGKKITFKIAM